MEKTIYFDLAAIVLLAILLYTTISRKMTKGVPDKLFISLILISLCTATADTVALYLDNTVALGNVASVTVPKLYWVHSIYLVLHSLTTVVYFLFIVSLTDTWHRLRMHKVISSLSLVPIGAVILLISINPLTGWMFTFDENYVYTRGVLFPVLYLVAILYILLAFGYVFVHRKLFTRRKIISIVAIAPLVIVAMVIQFIKPSLVVEMYANAIGLMFTAMTVQTPEEIIDSFTGLRKYSAYADDMKKNYSNQKRVTVIMINSVNFVSFQSDISFDAIKELVELAADRLTNINREMKLHAKLYYLDRGRFRVVLHGSYRNKAHDAANRINDELKKKFNVGDRAVELLSSICVCKCPGDIPDFKTLMTFGASFHEKISYTGRVRYANEIFGEKQFMLINKLDEIIENAYVNHKFEVYYQPIYSVKQKKFVSAEALLRLIDDDFGFVSPELFIPAAEKSGAIYKIGEYVIEEVCRFIASDEYKQLGLDYIEINLSAAQCTQDGLVEKVIGLMNKYGVSPDSINLEITETAVAKAQSAMANNLQKLNEAGISFSLDDYGTGYSNIKRVVSLPLKIVKLDKSFVNEMDNPKMTIVVESTVKMLKDMKIEIVVEGIETESMVEQFSELECDFIQGEAVYRTV